jgi:hypothetical protein
MSAAANDLLQAIHLQLRSAAALTVLIGQDGVRDRLVTGKRLPAVVIAELTTNDNSTATEPGEEHLLTLEVWSDADGQRAAQQIVGLVRALLHDADLPLPAHALVNLRHVSTRVRRQAKSRLFCAEMRFRAVTE